MIFTNLQIIFLFTVSHKRSKSLYILRNMFNFGNYIVFLKNVEECFQGYDKVKVNVNFKNNVRHVI